MKSKVIKKIVALITEPFGSKVALLFMQISVVLSLFFLSLAYAVEPVAPEPLPGLTDAQFVNFQAGQALFEKKWKINEGLGPLFNANSCVACHRLPVVGGAGPRYRANFLFGFMQNGNFDPREEHGRLLFQKNRISNVSPEQIPDEANAFSLRKVPSLLGIGLILAIPDMQLLANHAPKDSDEDGISGRAPRINGHIQRFGSQNHVATLRQFASDALEAEIDLIQDEVGSDVVTKIRDFILYLAPSPQKPFTPEAIQGEQLFLEIGCADCHTQSFTTSTEPFTTAEGETIDVTVLQGITIQPYSDFLLHNMGPELNDRVIRGSKAGAREYRTIPLWGSSQQPNNKLHDGRANNIHQAVLFHGGEAARARKEFLALPVKEQNWILDFIESL